MADQKMEKQPEQSNQKREKKEAPPRYQIIAPNGFVYRAANYEELQKLVESLREK